MKTIMNLETPALLLDLNVLENNIKIYQQAADDNGKELWPMIKTHKSTEIALLQQAAGARGFICGTLDECEALAGAGVKNIMYSYPVAAEANILRVIALTKACNFFIRIDDVRQGKILDGYAKAAGICLNYAVIINSGLNRFGIEPGDIREFMEGMKSFENLVFKGICTHPGHVYGCANYEGVAAIAEEEVNAMGTALKILKDAGYEPEFVGSGSTPTYLLALKNADINKFHPGNYVFMDNIQISLGIAEEKDCALTVLATVLSNPREGTYIIDAGSKCLGLDKGAHGGGAISGFGLVKGRPELTIARLSEEVGVIACCQGVLNIGDKIEIIPNHSCSAANMASYYVCKRGGEAVGSFCVDMRSNSKNWFEN